MYLNLISNDKTLKFEYQWMKAHANELYPILFYHLKSLRSKLYHQLHDSLCTPWSPVYSWSPVSVYDPACWHTRESHSLRASERATWIIHVNVTPLDNRSHEYQCNSRLCLVPFKTTVLRCYNHNLIKVKVYGNLFFFLFHFNSLHLYKIRSCLIASSMALIQSELDSILHHPRYRLYDRL